MNDYDFSTLNDKEFEEISKDLLNAKFNLGLQSFRTGRDKGVDLRFSTAKNINYLVVQAKHYLKSGYKLLKSKIESEELKKIQILNVERYVLVTSIDLTVGQKNELFKILSPYVNSANDIIGQKELNDYLSEFKEIEKKYYKLWFSSTNILQTIINNAVEGRTGYFLSQLKKKIEFYVVTEKIDQANEILKNEKILVITGQPGIGKTSLAEVIIFDRAKNGFKIHKVENVKEAEDLISPDNKQPQLFYFDDFLGANYTEIINSHRTETQLTNFVERVINTPNKYIVLTTRTVILNYATENYEKIGRSSLNDNQFELKLTDYTKFEKAQILYNHFYYREVGEVYYDVILNEKFYLKIINHKSYTPRIIEFITDSSRIKKFSSEEYCQFILNNLSNPSGIWSYSFNNQIEHIDRCLLITLFTFGNRVHENNLIKAFETRLQYEKNNHNQILDSNQFNKSIKILLNGFLTSFIENYNDSHDRYFQFINPSLADFLINYLKESFSERKNIVGSALSIKQLDRFDQSKSIFPLEKELQIIIKKRFENNEFEECQVSNSSEKCVEIMNAIIKYCKDLNTDKLLFDNFNKLRYRGKWDYLMFRRIWNIIKNLEDSPFTQDYIKNHFIVLIEKLMESIDEESDALYVEELFEKYEWDYKEYLNSERGKNSITRMIRNILDLSEEQFKEDIKDQVSDFSEVESIYSDLEDKKNDLLIQLSVNDIIEDDFYFEVDEDYWNEKITENQAENLDYPDYEYERGVYSSEKDEREESEDSKIDRLFD